MRQTSRLLFGSFLILAFVWASPAARADGVISSDFVFQMNSSLFAAPEYDFTPYLTHTETITLPDTVVQSEAPVSVRGISGQFSYDLTAGAKRLVLGTEFGLASKSVSAALTIREISVDAIVEKNVDGMLIRARIQGSCANIPLTLTAGRASIVGSVKTGVDESGLPTLAVPSFEARWNADSWDVGDFGCTLGNGFRDRVIAGLKSYLASPAIINPSLLSLLNSRLAPFQETIRTSFLKPKMVSLDDKGLSVLLQPRAIVAISGENFQVLGLAQFRFPSSTVNEDDSIMTTLTPPPISTAKSFALFVPEGLVTALNKMAFKTGLYVYRKRGQEIAGFRDLLANFFEEFFVWPELMYYSHRAEFLFDFYVKQAPGLSSLVDAGDGSILGNLAGPLEVTLWAPVNQGRKASYVRMMNFHAPQTTAFRLSFGSTTDGGPPAATLNMKLTPSAFTLGGGYDPAYASSLRNSFIDLGQIQSSVLSALSQTNVQLTVKPFAMSSVLSLLPNAFARTNGWLEIDFK